MPRAKTKPASPPRPAPNSVIVLGAGIVGAAIAWRLTRAGAAVTVIDRLAPGGLATPRSFAWINANTPPTPAYYALRRAAIAAWGRLGAALPGTAPIARGGLIWENTPGWTPEAELARLNAHDGEHGAYGARLVWKAELRALEPALADLPEAAVLAPLESAVDAQAVAARLLADAAAQGARLVIGAEALRLCEAGGAVTGVETDFGRFEAAQVVLATGAAAPELLAPLGFALPMNPRQGLILHTAPVAPVLRHVVLAPELHMRQDPDGRLVVGEVYSGNGPNGGLIGSAPAVLAEMLMAALRARLPDVAGLAPLRVMLGRRPEPGDGFPAVGAVPGVAGLRLAVMHSGVTLAPLVGALMAQEVGEALGLGSGSGDLAGAEAGADLAALFAPYRPARFAGAAG